MKNENSKKYLKPNKVEIILMDKKLEHANWCNCTQQAYFKMHAPPSQARSPAYLCMKNNNLQNKNLPSGLTEPFQLMKSDTHCVTLDVEPVMNLPKGHY